MRALLIIAYFLFQAIVAVAQCPKQENILERVEAINLLNEKPEIAIQKLEVWRKKYIKCKFAPDSIYAKILHYQGKALRTKGDINNSIRLTKEAIKINQKPGKLAYPANCVNGYFNLLLMYKELNDHKQMVQALNQIVRLTALYPERKVLEARAFNHLSLFYLENGDYQLSINYARMGRSSVVASGNKKYIAENIFMEGQAQAALQNWDEAIKSFKNAYEALGDDKDAQTAAIIYFKLAAVERRNKRFSSAINYLQKAVVLIEPFIKSEVTAKNNAAVFFSEIGDIYAIELKEYADALVYYQRAFEMSEDRLDKAQILGNQALVYKKQGKFDLSISTFQKSLFLNPSKPSENSFAKTINISPSKRILYTLISDKGDTWLAYAKSSSNDKKKLKNALKTYMLADTMIDYMRWEHTGNISKLFWRNKTRSMYENAIETCYLLGDAEKAFYFFEKSRAVMLNDQLNELGANQVLAAKDIANEKALRQQVSDLQNKLNEAEGNDKAATTIREKLFEAQEKQVAFIHNLEKTNPQYYAYKYDNSVLSFARLRREILPDNQTFLTYFVGESSVYGLHISLNKAILKKINLADFLTNSFELNRFIGSKALQNKSFDKYLSVSNNLYRQLILPFNIPLGTRIIVSPDGSFLPMQALSKSPSTPDFLVKYFAFSYTYSAGFLAKSTRKTVPFFPTKSFLGLAPLNFNARLAQTPLPGSDRTLRELGENFSFAKSLTGKEATRNAFVRDASNYRIVQLLTHATADSTGTIPTLYFSDSTLLLTELSPQNQSLTELLVLSACQTGVGKNQRGEGVFSLARGFAAIGIPSTITTLWSVENQPVYELTKLFYAGLKDNLPLDVALQQAQIQWLETASKTDQLPYSWAGIVMVGNADPIQTHSYVLSILLVLASIALLVGFIIFLKRRSPRR